MVSSMLYSIASCTFHSASADLLRELQKREAQVGIEADSDIDAFMTADTAQGKRESVRSELTMHLLGLNASPLSFTLMPVLGPLLWSWWVDVYSVLISDALFFQFCCIVLMLVCLPGFLQLQ